MRPPRRIAPFGAALLAVAFPALSSGQPSRGAAFGAGAPAFVVSSAPTSLTGAAYAGEPSIGVDWRTGAGLYMSGTDVFRLAFDLRARRVGWVNASPLKGLTQNLDPILATDSRTGQTLAGGDTGSCSVLYASGDDGRSWLPSLPCTFTYDHPTVAHAPSARTPGATVFYYCQQGPAVQECDTSTTAGAVWTPAAPGVQREPAFAPELCIGVHGHLAGSPDGTAYLPGRGCFRRDGSTGVGGMRTNDDGLTWTEYLIPSQTSTVFDPAVATTPDNTVYEAWEAAGTHHPLVAVSRSHGTTWTTPVDLAATVRPALVAASLPSLVAGDNGRVAYSFLGTAVGSGNPNAIGFHGVWFLYTSFSYDGGLTWTTVRDTPTPVQYGEIDAGGTTTTGQRNLLDFLGSAVMRDGRVVVAFADGCLAACLQARSPTAAEAASTSSWASVAFQVAGRGLFTAGRPPPLT